MSERVRYRFTVLAAEVAVVIGFLVILLGLAGGILHLVLTLLAVDVPGLPLAGLRPASKLGLSVLLAGAGLLVGGPFVVAGQCLLAFLDQHRLLRKIARQLRRAAPE